MKFSTVEPKVIIGVVTLRELSPQAHIGIVNLINHPLVVGHVVHIGSLLPTARNKLITDLEKITDNWTHLLLLDADTVGFTPDHLTKLIDANCDIIGAVVPHREPPFVPALALIQDNPEEINSPEEFFKYLLESDTHPKRINRVEYIGLAFTLIIRRVIEELPKPLFFTDRSVSPAAVELKNKLIKDLESGERTMDWSEAIEEAFGLGQTKAEISVGEDVNFCWSAKKHGFQTWVHLDVVLGHLGECAYTVFDYLNIMKGAQNRLEQKTIGLQKGLINAGRTQ
jgi:hypothetical protein